MYENDKNNVYDGTPPSPAVPLCVCVGRDPRSPATIASATSRALGGSYAFLTFSH